MKFSGLTQEQLRLLVKKNLEWLATNHPEWLAINHPQEMADLRSRWMFDNYSLFKNIIRKDWEIGGQNDLERIS